MEALAAGFPTVVGERLAAYQEAMRTQRAITQPLPLTPNTSLGKRKREDVEGTEGTEEYNAELERDRYLNDMKLKSRFEHIFSKYERSFEGIADEVDLFTGKVVVDNGHLQHIRTDLDLGGTHRGRLFEMLDDDSSDPEGDDEGAEVDDASWIGQDQDDVVEVDGLASITDQDELDESDDLADTRNGQGDTEALDGDMDVVSDDGFVTDNDLEEAGPAATNKDLWNNAPKLPGDVGYDPFTDSAGNAGFSSTVLKDFESGVSGQITQLVDALQKAQGSSYLNSQAAAGLKPQITIDLDPTSASYGKPVITYVQMEPQKQQVPRAAAANFSAEVHCQTNPSDADELLKRPKEIAATVLSRIADAGLPTVPGPDGKYPPYKSARAEQKGSRKQISIIGGTADNVDHDGGAIPIDPALEAATATEFQAEAAAAQDGAARDTPDSHYSANTARALERKLLPPGAPFSEEDDELILELKDNRGIPWEDIRDLCFQDRRVTALQYRYYTYLKSDCNNKFTEEDDKLLIQLREVESLSWPAIQRSYFTEFRLNQLQYRYYTKLCQVRKAPWTKEEDELLGELKDQRGLTWQQIKDQYFPKRTLGQVQYRYYTNARPADWKEQFAALTEAYDQAEASADDEAVVSRIGGSTYRHAKHGSLIWGLRRRLAGASTKLTETKRQQHAVKKQKLEEHKRREAARLAAQEVKRQAREIQNIAKLKAMRAAQEAAKPKPRLTNRDIVSISPEPEMAIEDEVTRRASLQSGSRSHSLDVNRGPQTAQQQFEAAIAQYEDYQDPKRALWKRPGRRMLEDEEDERERRQEQRHIFEQAAQLGPLLLPKPPVTESTAFTSQPALSFSPHASRLLERDVPPPIELEHAICSVIYPINPLLYTPAPPLPRSDGTVSSPAFSAKCASVARIRSGNPMQTTTEPPLTTATAEGSSQAKSPAPATLSGPVSKVWTLPKLYQPAGNARPASSRPQPAMGTFKPARRTKHIIVPFPSRSPILETRRSLPKKLSAPTQPALLQTNHNAAASVQIDEEVVSSTEHDAFDDAATISEVDSPAAWSSADSPEPLETESVLADNIASPPAPEASTSRAESGAEVSRTRTVFHELLIQAEKYRAPHASPIHSHRQRISGLIEDQKLSRDFPAYKRSVERPQGRRNPASRSHKPRAPKKRTIVEDSESDAPTSVNLSSGSDASGSDHRDGSEARSLDSDTDIRAIDTSMTELDASDDELTTQADLLENRVLGMRASLSFADSRLPRKATTPQKQTAPRRLSGPASKSRDLAPKVSGLRASHGVDADDDELA